MTRRPQAYTPLNAGGIASPEHHRWLDQMAVDLTSAQADITALLGRDLVAFGQQPSAHNLDSTTGWQSLFDIGGANGVSLDVGKYRFECRYRVTSMSATSGNAGFGLRGTATYSSAPTMWMNFGSDGGAATALALSGMFSASNEQDVDVVTAGTSQSMSVTVLGTFGLSAAGIVRPNIKLTTAASAVVAAGSSFFVWRIGTLATDTIGTWS